MRKHISFLIAGILAFAASSAFADVIRITGSPVSLEQRGTVYYYPATTTTTTTATTGTNYYYYKMGGTNRVCYMEEQPNLRLSAIVASVDIGGTVKQLHCYETDPAYFEVVE